MDLAFEGYTFTFQLLTTVNRYEPENFSFTENSLGWIACSQSFSMGDGASIKDGKFEVTFVTNHDGFSWKAKAEFNEPIKGIKVAVKPIPLGKVTVPSDYEFTLNDGDRGRVFVYPGGYYPLRHVSSTQVIPESGPLPCWAAQFALVHSKEGTFFLSSHEYPPRVKKIWFYRKWNFQEIHLYSEENAFERKKTYSAPEWMIGHVKDWRNAVAGYAQWMSNAFGMSPFAQRPNLQSWMKDIGLTVILHGIAHDGKIGYDFQSMASCLSNLSRLYPANKTLIKITGFEGSIDRHWPTSKPSNELGGEQGFRNLIRIAHHLGYHVIPHLNIWGASFEKSETKELLKHQIRDQEGRPVTWSYDYDQDEIAEEIFAYISPDVPEWREILKGKIREVIEFGVDAIYLDQTGTFINDLCHDHYSGLRTLYEELSASFPTTQFTCEAPITEISASLCSVLCGIPIFHEQSLVDLYNILFGPFIRSYGYNLPPEPFRGIWGSTNTLDWWSEERYKHYYQRSNLIRGIPSINLVDQRIKLDSDRIRFALEFASNYRIVDSEI
jgi:hypothetical protein